MKKLYLHRLRVQVALSGSAINPADAGYATRSYLVEAPSQCSATKHTMLRSEVSEMLHVEQFTDAQRKELEQSVNAPLDITFTTTEECP